MVNRHEQRSVAREQICAAICGDIDRFRVELQHHQSLIDQQKGGIKVAHFSANIIGIIPGTAAANRHFIEEIW